jgi:DNA-binding response OmpR family regulator
MKTKTKEKRVLVIDGNKNMARCLAEMVEVFGLDCDTAFDGDDVLGLIGTRKYSLIIADSKAPRLNGISLLKYVKKNYPEIAVTVTSIRNSQNTQDIVAKNKADFYLPKPFKVADLEEILNRI